GTHLILGSGGVILDGSGTVALADQPNNALTGTVLSNVDNTISGAGFFGGALQLTNLSGGRIIATAASNQLVIGTTSHTMVNEGLIEATGAAGLLISYTTVDDTSGGVLSAASGSHIDLQSATI